MTSKALLFALLSLLMALNACKEPVDDEINYPGPRIKKMSTYFDGKLSFETTYQYDATGRVIKESVSGQHSIRYSYLPGKVVMEATLPDNTEDIPADTMLLNDKGLQTSDYPSTTIEYDDYGYLVEMTLLINNVPNSHIFKIENGNTVQWTLRTGNQLEKIAMDQRYEFLPNSFNTIGYDNIGMAWMGKQNENLVSKTTYISHGPASTFETFQTYEYELDAKNRVVKKSTVDDPRNDYTLYTYY